MANDQKAVSIEMDLGKPVTALINRAADGFGVLYEPKRIVKKAKAEAEAAEILALSGGKPGGISERAVKRMVAEEVKKQVNMEKILEGSLARLNPEARPDDIDDEWLANFFSHARNSSDAEMQDVWARILSGEANQPGTFSKRTINLMAGISKEDALSFSKLINTAWDFNGLSPLIYNIEDEIYTSNGITFNSVNRLSSIGLMTFQPLSGYVKKAPGTGGSFTIVYQGTPYNIKVPEGVETVVQIGKVLLTDEGSELARVCSFEKIKGFEDYVEAELKKVNVELTKFRI
jgi:hypothetical protein